MTRRVGVVFPFALEPGHLGKDVCLIPEGLAALGLDVALYCPEARGGPWPVAVVAAGAGALEDPDYWRGQKLDAAVVYSFLRYDGLVAAIAAAGTRVVAKGDTTGRVIARAHPGATLTEARFAPETPRARLLSLGSWLARWGPLHRREARAVLAATRAASATVVETASARAALAHELAREGAPELADRLVVVPNPVAAAFARTELRPERERLVVAVGRWDLRIKDAPLLRGALDRFLAEHEGYRAVVVGRGQGRRFAGGATGRIESSGPIAQPELADLLGRARIVVSTSRSESFSLALHEGLAQGCSVAGPPLAPVEDAVAAGPFGTLATGRGPADVAAALSAEARAWDAGRRDPVAGGAFWRERLDGGAIARRFAELLAR